VDPVRPAPGDEGVNNLEGLLVFILPKNIRKFPIPHRLSLERPPKVTFNNKWKKFKHHSDETESSGKSLFFCNEHMEKKRKEILRTPCPGFRTKMIGNHVRPRERERRIVNLARVWRNTSNHSKILSRCGNVPGASFTG
jgi:hypothetical protein